MCLDELRPGETPCEEGYKVLRVIEDHLYPMYQKPHGCPPIPENQWVNEKDYRRYHPVDPLVALEDTIEYDYGSYPKGFHTFHNLEDAKRWTSIFNFQIYKVAVRKPKVVGLQTTHRQERDPNRIEYHEAMVTVSEEIKLLERVA